MRQVNSVGGGNQAGQGFGMEINNNREKYVAGTYRSGHVDMLVFLV